MSNCESNMIRNEAFAYYAQLQRVLEFCEDNFRDHIDLKQVADVANLERTYFSTYFHEKVGVCFKCWLGIMRIEKAKVQIRTANCTISQLANEVGFANVSTFGRTFKRHTGLTPMEYKKKYRPC